MKQRHKRIDSFLINLISLRLLQTQKSKQASSAGRSNAKLSHASPRSSLSIALSSRSSSPLVFDEESIASLLSPALSTRPGDGFRARFLPPLRFFFFFFTPRSSFSASLFSPFLSSMLSSFVCCSFASIRSSSLASASASSSSASSFSSSLALDSSTFDC